MHLISTTLFAATILGLVAVPAAAVLPEPPTERPAAAGVDRSFEGISEKDKKRMLGEIQLEGLAQAPVIWDVTTARSLPAKITAVVVAGGDRATLEGLAHLPHLDELYLVIGQVSEDDLAALAEINSLRHLHLGMDRRYRLKGKLWGHLGKLTQLKTLNVNCHS